MENQITVLVVIDPSHDTHPAMERGLLLAKRADGRVPTKMVFLLAPTQIPGNNSKPVICSSDWIREKLYEPLKDLPIDYGCVMSWSANSNDAILSAAEHLKPTLTIVPYYEDGNHSRLFSDEKWKLLREAKSPVIIASKESSSTDHSRKILCAFKMQDNTYDERNERIANAAQKFQEYFGLEAHGVNAYSSSMEFPDRSRIASMSGIKNENIHITLGEPEDVICDTAEEVDADIIILASTQRKGWKGALRGNTIEKIIQKLDRDVLMI